MEIRIIETGELRELHTYKDGIDWIADLIGNSGVLNDTVNYNAESGEYETDAETFAWWDRYVSNYNADEEVLDEIRREFGESEVNEMIANEFVSPDDYNDHHRALQNFMCKIRRRFKRIVTEKTFLEIVDAFQMETDKLYDISEDPNARAKSREYAYEIASAKLAEIGINITDEDETWSLGIDDIIPDMLDPEVIFDDDNQ